MAKIRSFKPDFWTDSKLVQIPFEARLMFMGLWTYACDNGHVDDDPLQLKMRVFPADDVDVAHLLEVLAGSALIERKDGVVTVLNLSRHQHINKRYFTSCEHCATTPVKPEQQGTTLHNGGKEKKPVDGECDCECDGDGDKPQVAAKVRDGFADFWKLYPLKKAKGAAEKSWKTATKKTDPDVILTALREQLPSLQMQRRTDGDFRPQPATWLNQRRWEDEVEDLLAESGETPPPRYGAYKEPTDDI